MNALTGLRLRLHDGQPEQPGVFCQEEENSEEEDHQELRGRGGQLQGGPFHSARACQATG